MRTLLTPLSVLVRPRAAFARLGERPRWVWAAAMLVLLATFLVKVTLDVPHILEMQDELMRDANVGVTFTSDESEGGVRAPEDARRSQDEEKPDDEVVVPEGAEDVVRTMTLVSSYVFGSLGVVLGTLALAGVAYGASRLWSSEAPFAVVLGVIALAKMPDAVRNVVQAVYTAGSGSWVRHQGLGALVAPAKVSEAPSVAYALLSMVDVYSIWFWALLFVGLTVAVGLERKRAAILTGSFLAIAIVFAVVPALVAGAFMPG